MYILIHKESVKRLKESIDFVRNRLSDAGVMHLLNVIYTGRFIETDDKGLTIHFTSGSNTGYLAGIRPDYYYSDTPAVRHYLTYRGEKRLDDVWQACELAINFLKEKYLLNKNCFWYDVCKEGLDDCTDGKGCKDCGFYKESSIDLNAVATTANYQPKEAPKPKTYLTTYNPYISKDWKEIFKKRLEEYPWGKYSDTDVASMYPKFTPAQNKLSVKLNGKHLCDTLDAARYSFEKYCDYAMEKNWEDFYYMLPPRHGKSVALDAIKLGEKELEYCKRDVEETVRLYEAFKEKEEDMYDWMAHSWKEIMDDMGTILHRRQIAEKDFKSNEWVWEISEDIWQRLKEKPEFISNCYSTSLPATIYCIDVCVTKFAQNYIKLIRKVKKEENMGLYDATGYVKYRSINYTLPKIKDVKFEDPATIVFWADGTKTVVRAQDEAYDPEKGLAMAIARKAMGNKREYYHVFLKWLKKFQRRNAE